MRVLTVGNLYPPHHFGGYEQVWAAAVAHLMRRGHQVRVLAVDYRHPGVRDPDPPEVLRVLRWYWRDHDFDPLPYRERLRIERHNQRELARQLNEFDPQVVSFWSMGGMSHSLIEQTRRRDIPIVCFVHDQWLDYGRTFDQWTRMSIAPGYRRLAPMVEMLTGIPTRVSYGVAGRYVFVSDFVRQRALALGLGLGDTDVAPSGIAPVFAPSEPPDEWEWRLLYVGRLHPDKGIEEALRCLTLLPDQATLTFAGSWDPRDEDALGDLVMELGLESRVTMLGQLTPTEVAGVYRRSHVLLFPVRWDEPWGLVPLEAMASGCPVVATGRGGSAEYLRDGENCLLVPAGDPSGLAEAVGRLAESRSLRDRLRAAGIETASGHTEEAFNRSVERHLSEVAGVPIATSDAAEPDQRDRREGGPSPGGPKYSSTRAGTPPTSV